MAVPMSYTQSFQRSHLLQASVRPGHPKQTSPVRSLQHLRLVTFRYTNLKEMPSVCHTCRTRHGMFQNGLVEPWKCEAALDDQEELILTAWHIGSVSST